MFCMTDGFQLKTMLVKVDMIYDLWNHYIFGEIIKYRKPDEYSISNVNLKI